MNNINILADKPIIININAENKQMANIKIYSTYTALST